MSGPTFRGIIPPLVTPLDDQRDLDLAGLERLVERVVAGGVHGVFALGTTGEGPSLPMPLRQQAIAAVCDQVAGRVPVLVGVTDTIFGASCELADAAFAAGAAAAVVAPPYYLPMNQAELTGYTVRLADRLPLPLMLYNMPSCCKTWFEPQTVLELSRHENIAGLKDSSGDLSYLRRVVDGLSALGARDDFSLFVGPEEMLVEALDAGAHGGVHGGANMFPTLYVEMYEATMRGDRQRAAEAQQLVRQISAKVYHASDGASRIIKGTKTILRLLNVCGDQLAEPFERHTDAARHELQRELERLLPELTPFMTEPASPEPERARP